MQLSTSIFDAFKSYLESKGSADVVNEGRITFKTKPPVDHAVPPYHERH